MKKIPNNERWDTMSSRDMDFQRISLFSSAVIKNLKKIFGKGYSVRASYCHKGFVDSFVKLSDLDSLALYMANQVKKQSSFIPNFIKKYYQAVDVMNKELAHYLSIDLKKTSDAKLAKILNNYFELYKDLLGYGAVCNRVASMAFTPIIVDFLSRTNFSESLDEVINKVVIPGKETYVFSENKTFIQIIKYLKAKPKLMIEFRKRLNSSSFSVGHLLAKYNDKKLDSLLKQYQSYLWVMMSMHKEGWEMQVRNKFKDGLKMTLTKVNQMDADNTGRWDIMKKNKAVMLKLLKPTKEVANVIYILSEFVSIRDHFGSYNRYLPIAMKPIFDETAKRIKIKPALFPHLTQADVSCALLKKTNVTKIANSRIGTVALYDDVSGQKIMIGQQAVKFYNQKIKPYLVISESTELKGQIANKGVATGTARRVKTIADLKNVIKGDILISPNTTTEMLSAIRKVKAIVTDEGGLASHAAIIAREFNVPCIVGTKYGTTLIKSGDRVMVDANTGVVKILK